MKEMPQDRQEPLQQVQEPIVAVVVPCYNEEAVLEHTHKALSHKLASLIDSRSISAQSFICYVDDGSRDRTWEILCDLVDSRGDLACGLESQAGSEKVDSSKTLSTQDSKAFSQNAQNLSDSQAEAKVDSMDCHDFASAKSRNDRKTQNLNNSAKDSKIAELESGLLDSRRTCSRLDFSFSPSAWDSRIVDEKAGLRRLLRGDKTWRSIAQAKGKLPALSLQAESLNKFPPPPPLLS